jgi:hypothetical protein
MGSNVISLARARRRFAHRFRRRQFHPVANHLAIVIPFPGQVRPESLTSDARFALDRRAVVRGKRPKS